MGNTPVQRTHQPQLEVLYDGPVIGPIKHGVVVTNKPDNAALHPEIVKSMVDSLGSLTDMVVAPKDDLKEFTLELPFPPENPKFVPCFFDRGDEYGAGHKYYEGLCHAFSHRQIISSSSARFFNRKNGTGISTPHLPATFQICALVESVRRLNKPFLDQLKINLLKFSEESKIKKKELVQKYEKIKEEEKKISESQKNSQNSLNSESTKEEREEEIRKRKERVKEEMEIERDDLTEKLVDEFIEGAWRSVAIQLHFSGASKGIERLMHFDHVFSSLHLAVTLNGRRTVSMGISTNEKTGEMVHKTAMSQYDAHNYFQLHLQSGDVYCTTPAGIYHGVSTEDLKEEERSVALQCRTLLDLEASRVWNLYTPELCQIVNSTLKEFPTKMPNFSEFDAVLQELVSPSTTTATQTEKFTFNYNLTKSSTEKS